MGFADARYIWLFGLCILFAYILSNYLHLVYCCLVCLAHGALFCFFHEVLQVWMGPQLCALCFDYDVLLRRGRGGVLCV